MLSQPEPPFNSLFADQLSKLEQLMKNNGDTFRSTAYRKAKQAIVNYPDEIMSVEQIKDLKGIGKTIVEKLTQFVQIGQIELLAQNESDTSLLETFTNIYGVGPKNAQKIISAGITSIDQLRDKQDAYLNDKQKLGLRYYEDINLRIPRSEIDEYNSVFQNYFDQAKTHFDQKDALFQIVGSYRRETPDSGDIDVIITNPVDDKCVFTLFISLLTQNNIILHKLTNGDKQIKILVICQLPGKPARRVDFMYSPYCEFPFALLYFTGSQLFNTAMRQFALDAGYTMNEHRLQNISTSESIHSIHSEKDIFKYLKLQYVEPKNRKDKSSLTPITSMKLSDPFLTQFRKNGVAFLKTQTEQRLTDFITTANDRYYNTDSPILTDSEYDALTDFMYSTFPHAPILQQVGAPIASHDKTKATLPFNMPSMDKKKPNTAAIDTWLNTYNSPNQYVLSVKLDGVSGLYDGRTKQLYTRGNGIVGQNISHLIPYISLPTNTNVIIRGEFVISKQNFAKFPDNANARNTVAGLLNAKTLSPKLEFVDFVAYEILGQELSPSEQFEMLSKIYPKHVCQYTIVSAISNDILADLLLAWRSQSQYDMDGVIVSHDKIYARTTSNPAHSFAFKMVLTEQSGRAQVVDVIWTPSKDGYLKPRVQIVPITLGGVVIEYATGFNGAFIKNNTINVGAIIEIIRSGDVIPHINRVIEPASSPKMPDVPYIWNDTHIDILLESKEDNDIVIKKNIRGFFVDVDGLGPGIISNLVDAGYNTVPKILAMSKDNFLSVPGFKEKLATKVHTNIHTRIQKLSLPELMTASNIFGRGFGDKRLSLILKEYPDILTSTESDTHKVAKLTNIKGLAQKTAQLFVNNIQPFLTFVTNANLTNKLSHTPPTQSGTQSTDHPLYGKSVVFTGVRDKNLEAQIIAVGATIDNQVKKTSSILVTNDANATSSKINDANKHGVAIMLLADFKLTHSFT